MKCHYCKVEDDKVGLYGHLPADFEAEPFEISIKEEDLIYAHLDCARNKVDEEGT